MFITTVSVHGLLYEQLNWHKVPKGLIFDP